MPDSMVPSKPPRHQLQSSHHNSQKVITERKEDHLQLQLLKIIYKRRYGPIEESQRASLFRHQGISVGAWGPRSRASFR
ncbi:hypothetical protein CDAR_122061 [Caerostris darwini]|uniref:Uncharacterized protein n=1 Tax=Caerostris darwini TaxID=1538125 RepID=A0AAV4QX79_9ARAC|nr:hypothetical protein CDAR_122061 [Caerostris darwini]